MPIVLSVVEPYNASFITSEEHLPPLFSTLYHPVNSEKSHSEVNLLLTIILAQLQSIK